jgi:hypothetical protein
MREELFHQHLENVSPDLPEAHPDVVKHFIGTLRSGKSFTPNVCHD